MALVLAYSQEYGEVIDAEMAYDLYWSGVIRNKSAFTCPSTNCAGKVTCANLDKAQQDLQQSPHFRSYGHDKQCDIDEVTGLVTSETKSIEAGGNAITEFFVQRPKDMFSKRRSPQIKQHAASSSKHSTPSNHQPAYYTVRSLVSKFIQYRKLEQLQQKMIKIGDQQQTYKQLFKGIYNQSVSRLPTEKTIYWGLAYIDKLKKSGDYRIKFIESFQHEDEAIHPSFFISHAQLDQYAVKSLLQTRLEKVIAEKDKRAFVFIYADTPKLSNAGDYINFKPENLDHIEVRYLELFEQLKK